MKYKGKQRGPRTDCSYRSSLNWVRGFLNISADEKSRRLINFCCVQCLVRCYHSEEVWSSLIWVHNVCRWSRLLQIIDLHYWRIKYRSKQRGPGTDCSYRSSLIWVHTVCHRGFLNISADEEGRRLFHECNFCCVQCLVRCYHSEKVWEPFSVRKCWRRRGVR